MCYTVYRKRTDTRRSSFFIQDTISSYFENLDLLICADLFSTI